ncbi:class I SAM-dependent methyltransferase [Anaeromyxobacter oryzisoli]|uniref:class I SAM-dependent methyltransferase n=1 Tax=Anaeromyxobacter oryzisoli TaxID=2925408 RepID=UPI001F5672B2|nr:class I SAM-dependent methyltransferase [Anaeromyxobacter sp. SG63]
MTASPGTFEAAAPWETEWPREQLEPVPRCAVCGSSERTTLYEGLTDRIFRVAPGTWTLWRCAGCGAAFLDPRPTLGGIGLAYRCYYTHDASRARHVFSEGTGVGLLLRRLRLFAYYDDAFGYALRPAAPGAAFLTRWSAARRARADHLIRHLPAPSGRARLLDVGCGNGDFLRIGRALGFDVVGLDLDEVAAARARASGLAVHVGTLDDVALEPGTFEHVTLSHVLEHVHDPVGALRRVHALLRPGGRVWIQTPNVEAEGLRRFGPDWRGLEPPRHLTLFGPESLRRALGAVGFERIALLPPRREAAFYVAQSLMVRRGASVDRSGRAPRARIGAEARRMDRAALRCPERGESLTAVAWRPEA